MHTGRQLFNDLLNINDNDHSVIRSFPKHQIDKILEPFLKFNDNKNSKFFMSKFNSHIHLLIRHPNLLEKASLCTLKMSIYRVEIRNKKLNMHQPIKCLSVHITTLTARASNSNLSSSPLQNPQYVQEVFFYVNLGTFFNLSVGLCHN